VRKMILVLGLAGGMGVLAGPVSAHVAPGPGFGEHIRQMTPEHPREHGRMFGVCVATMATTGECPHGH
jgi:hypothetical protein